MKCLWPRTPFLILLIMVACDPSSSGGQASRAQERSVRVCRSAEALLLGLISDARRLNQPSNQQRFQALISLLRKRRLDYEIQPFATDSTTGQPSDRGHNVVLSFGRGDRGLVLGAHYDAAQLPSGRIGPGMVDNAAGVVVLVQLAEAIRHDTFNKRIHIVFFDQEETGLAGSRHFVNSPKLGSIDAMINIDLVGYGDTVMFGPTARTPTAEVEQALRLACSQLLVDCFFSPQLPAGDFVSFDAAGIPSISLAILPSLDAHQVWLMLNKPSDSTLPIEFHPSIAKVVHTSNDTVDKLDPTTMTMACHLISLLLARLDQLP